MDLFVTVLDVFHPNGLPSSVDRKTPLLEIR